LLLCVRSSSGAAAANKVHNLQPVPVLQAGVGPLRTGNDIAVVLDRHPVAFESQVSDQVQEVGRSRQLRKFPRLTVKNKMHTGRVSPAHNARILQPLPHAFEGRLHFGAGIIDGAVESLKDLDSCHARVGAS
jgi:hypothetical protein